MASEPKPFAFVLMPFDAAFNDIYRLGIQDTARDCGVIAERVDEQIYSEGILERIYRQIDNADIIIADMTGKNPNVFYEVGYAHAKTKICTLLTQNAADIPFDLKHHRHLVYDGSITKLQELLRVEFSWISEQIKSKKETVFDVTVSAMMPYMNKNEYRADGKISLKIDIKNRSDRRSPEIDAIYICTRNRWVFSENGKPCNHIPDENAKDCRKHFLSSPVRRLAPGAWAQITTEGCCRLWSKYAGDEDFKDIYIIKGTITIEIVTDSGIFEHSQFIETTFEDISF